MDVKLLIVFITGTISMSSASDSVGYEVDNSTILFHQSWLAKYNCFPHGYATEQKKGKLCELQCLKDGLGDVSSITEIGCAFPVPVPGVPGTSDIIPGYSCACKNIDKEWVEPSTCFKGEDCELEKMCLKVCHVIGYDVVDMSDTEECCLDPGNSGHFCKCSKDVLVKRSALADRMSG